MNEPGTTPLGFRFSMASMLYVMTVLIAGYFAAGWLGLLFAAWVCTVQTRRFTCFEGLIFLFILGMLVGLGMPTGYGRNRSASSADERLAAIQDLAFAAKHHCRLNGHYPKDLLHADGKALSWRVRFLDQLETENFGAPDTWDAETLKEVVEYEPDSIHFYHRHSERRPRRYIGGSYYAITGTNTAWTNGTFCPDYDNVMYESHDALLIEANMQILGKNCVEASDLTAEVAIQLLTSTHPDSDLCQLVDYGWLWREVPVRHIVFPDGSVARLHGPIGQTLAEALIYTHLTITDWQKRELEFATWRPLDYRVIIGWPLFAFLAVRPWRWGGRGRSEAEPPAND